MSKLPFVNPDLIDGFDPESEEIKKLIELERLMYNQGDKRCEIIAQCLDYLYTHGIIETRYQPPKTLQGWVK